MSRFHRSGGLDSNATDKPKRFWKWPDGQAYPPVNRGEKPRRKGGARSVAHNGQTACREGHGPPGHRGNQAVMTGRQLEDATRLKLPEQVVRRMENLATGLSSLREQLLDLPPDLATRALATSAGLQEELRSLRD